MTVAARAALPIRLERLACSTRKGAVILDRPSPLNLREQSLRPHRQNGEKGEMPGELLPAGIDVRADGLRHAEDDAARQRSPLAAEAADDDGFEAEDQARRSDRRIEIGAYGNENAGDRNDGERDCHGDSKDMAVVEPHQLRNGGVVRGGTKGAPQGGAIEQYL